MKYIDQVVVTLRNKYGNMLPVIIDVYDNSLSRKWLNALNLLLKDDYHLEKNYCFFGFVGTQRNAEYIVKQINRSIAAINAADLGYQIDDHFSIDNTIVPGPVTGVDGEGGSLVHSKLNQLHRYFEDLQGVSGSMSVYYNLADSTTRWHIRQLNLLCHEYETLVLSMRKAVTAPEWVRPSQLMCWLNAPRFKLEEQDYELFGIESLNRPLGGVFVGVNKAVGKHHWEVFVDEAKYNPNYVADNLTTSTMRPQCEAAGDFDIEWANNPGNYAWQKTHLQNFRTWLINNNFDPDDKSLTIGHPQIGQVNLLSSFGTTDYKKIWDQLAIYQDVYKVRTSSAEATYTYCWSDPDYQEQQTRILK
jgi:hypothetical protein